MNPSRQADPLPPAISFPTVSVQFLMRQKPGRDRLDRALVLRGLAESREQAGRLILSGNVRVDGVPVDKQARLVPLEARPNRTSAEGAGSSRLRWKRFTLIHTA